MWSGAAPRKLTFNLNRFFFFLFKLNKNKTERFGEKTNFQLSSTNVSGISYCPTLFTLFLKIALVSKDIICSTFAWFLIIMRREQGL